MASPRNEISPNQVVLNLLELSRQLQQLSDNLDELELEAVHAKEAHTVAYARAFLDTSQYTGKAPSVDVRKQQALLDTSNERLAAEIAEAKVRAAKNQISTLKVRIDVGRSAAALVRAEADLMTMGGRARGGA